MIVVLKLKFGLRMSLLQQLNIWCLYLKLGIITFWYKIKTFLNIILLFIKPCYLNNTVPVFNNTWGSSLCKKSVQDSIFILSLNRICRPHEICDHSVVSFDVSQIVLLKTSEAATRGVTGKPLCQIVIFNNVAGLKATLLKYTLALVFSCKFCKISKNIFFTEDLCTDASKNKLKDFWLNFLKIIWIDLAITNLVLSCS